MSSQNFWVSRLFARLEARYGARWLKLWEGINPDAIRADWEEQLGQLYERNPDAIRYGLDHLPEHPPTSDQFLACCLRAPPQHVALDSPRGDAPTALLKEVAEIIRKAGAERSKDPGRRVMENLRTFEQRHGIKMTWAQREQLAALEKMYAPPPVVSD